MESPRVRRPALAGYFYPAEAALLREAVDNLSDYRGSRGAAQAVVVPHGSFRQCGGVSAAVLSRCVIPRRCIILGPSHTGSWMPWSIMARGWYRTPLGDVPVDADLSDALLGRCGFLETDAWAHRGEQAIEAALPFLQRWAPANFSVVPIIAASDDEVQMNQLAQAIAQSVRMTEEPVLLIASSDFSHFEPVEVVIKQDKAILERVRAFDASGLMRLVRDSGSRMCGANSVSCVLLAAKALGAGNVEQLSYATSADCGGDARSAIGYSGLRIF